MKIEGAEEMAKKAKRIRKEIEKVSGCPPINVIMDDVDIITT